MARLLIAVILAAAAGGLALVLQRRRPRRGVGAPQWSIPTTLDRADFDRPGAPWLVAVFSSATCDTCAAVWERAQLLESADVAVQNVEARDRRDLHERYLIDAVPLVAVADAGGTVRAHFLGPTTAADLWGALAELRDPAEPGPKPGAAGPKPGAAGPNP